MPVTLVPAIPPPVDDAGPVPPFEDVEVLEPPAPPAPGLAVLKSQAWPATPIATDPTSTAKEGRRKIG
jgi:hypothetical protein